MQKYYILVIIQSIFDALLYFFALSILTPYTAQIWPNDRQKPTTAARSQPYHTKNILPDTAKCLLLAVCKHHAAKSNATNNFLKSYLLPENRFLKSYFSHIIRFWKSYFASSQHVQIANKTFLYEMLPMPYKGTPFNQKPSYQLVNQPTHQLKTHLLCYIFSPNRFAVSWIINIFAAIYIGKPSCASSITKWRKRHPCPTISYPNNRI